MEKIFECPAFDFFFFFFKKGFCELGEDAKNECDEAWEWEDEEE